MFHCFADYKILVKIRLERRLNVFELRTDNGLEFFSQQIDNMCRDSKVKRHKTCPYIPQQNGVSKRMNISIMDKARSMFVETNLDGSYQSEVAPSAVYIINKSPNAPIKFEIPEKKRICAKPSYDHLRCFQCIAYLHQVK